MLYFILLPRMAIANMMPRTLEHQTLVLLTWRAVMRKLWKLLLPQLDQFLLPLMPLISHSNSTTPVFTIHGCVALHSLITEFWLLDTVPTKAKTIGWSRTGNYWLPKPKYKSLRAFVSFNFTYIYGLRVFF